MSWSWKRRAFKLISNAKKKNKKIKMKQSREIITDGHGRCLLHGAGESRIYFFGNWPAAFYCTTSCV
jgi:hypothetical protein